MRIVIVLSLCFYLPSNILHAQTSAVSAYQELRYRMIGPFRAGRTVGAVGVASHPNVFYMGVNNGGVWKTTDYGRTWKPLTDRLPTSSIGDIAVSPSQPQILYAGSGEGLHRPDLSIGDGIYRSNDGGATWKHLGLVDIQQVGRIIVHPRNPDEVFVAGLGHPYGSNAERGVFRTKDGGKTWKKVLFIDVYTGAIQVEYHPQNPAILFASLWQHQDGPWENGQFSGPGSGLYTSRDGGDSWEKVLTGLPGPADGLGRIGICFAPSNPQRMYATVDARRNGGIYRSDNGGKSWSLVSSDGRTWGRGSDFAEVKVHPKNPDVVFIANVAAYRSDNAGKSWVCIKGAPGGDDYHRIWINPNQPEIMLFAADQGAVVTVNGGATWSSWYNQPTAQLYHVSTDNQFPYHVYGGQQESGAIGITSRGSGGQISFRDGYGVGADEYAYVAPDPLNPDLIYGGRVLRYNKKTGQTQHVGPEALRSGRYRVLRTMPLMFHPADPKTLLFATNVLWKTQNGGESWEIISPDLSRMKPEIPPSLDKYATPELENMARRGVIYSLGPSPLDIQTIWAGTDDGLVHVTRDGGKTWVDVTPPDLKSWDKISQIDAGHFDENTAYISVNAFRKDDLSPYIYKTKDGGQSWQLITNGISRDPVNVVREDPLKPGLLFAGTEREVFFSADDGQVWHSLRLNMPATSIRDLVIHKSDLVLGTHGRSVWILDNFSILRSLPDDQGKAHLFQPDPAIRVRWNMFTDTPLPPEEPAGENPPDGAILDYHLPQGIKQVNLEIRDSKGTLVRRFSSDDQVYVPDSGNMAYPTYWVRPQVRLKTSEGHHRFLWDMKYPPPPGAERGLSIAAVFKQTPFGPDGPWVAPGKYLVRLQADGVLSERSLVVRMDPRLQVQESDIRLQTFYSMACYQAYLDLQAKKEILEKRLSLANLEIVEREKLSRLLGQVKPGAGDILYGSIYENSQETITGLQDKFLYMMQIFQTSDSRPTNQAMQGVDRLLQIKETLVKL